MKQLWAVLFFLPLLAGAQEYTRGVGVYPGDPREDFGPTATIDSTNHRNLALHRPAWHSSSYDYNLTAQLVTDGIKETRPPFWLETSTSQDGVLTKAKRELMLDGNWVTNLELKGSHAWLQFHLAGPEPPEVDRIAIDGSVVGHGEPENWSCTVLGSDDANSWKTLGTVAQMARPRGGEIRADVRLTPNSRYAYYRLRFQDPRATGFQVGEVRFYRGNDQVWIGGPHNFSSTWMSAGSAEEWVYVDLGASANIDQARLTWIRRPAAAELQTSNDAKVWKTLQALTASSNTDDLKFGPIQARYVRVLMHKAQSPAGYALTEFEVFGRGGPVPQPQSAPSLSSNGRQLIAAGNWRVQRDSLVSANGETLSRIGFKDDDWITATVPGTILTSYLNAGAVPDPNFGNDQVMISDSFFYADFWYRNEFVASTKPAKHTWLNFDGINWKAEVYLNGERLGRIDGGFTRGKFDVTRLLHAGQTNAIAVRIIKNATPGAMKEKNFDSPGTNGGALGADNPTYHASIGWDWIPTVRGRDTGIWGKVYLSTSGPATLEGAYVQSRLPLPDTNSADVSVEVTVNNHDAQPLNGTLVGTFGEIPLRIPVKVAASASTVVKFDPSNTPALRIKNPKLWWPAGYGDPFLYPVKLRLVASGDQVSDEASFQAGIREFSYSNEDDDALKIWINGRRFIARGGNWGFGESMLRYRGREYNVGMRYHADMHFNMVRNWVGQIGDDEFYEACDRNGIVVWQDFWLANPWDGPDPDDTAMFLANSSDFVQRIRSHASIGLYCGRNEGFPPKPIDDGIRQLLHELHPGMRYIGSSADGPVSGHGPYRAMPLKFYFTERATEKMHSELGMPNIVTMDSLRQMMPESAMWPQGDIWGVHDFSLHGAQGGESFIAAIDKNYGGASNAADWISLAQFVNYEGYRAMFEAQSKHRMGLLIWMSHPAWPTFVWQTYDYYFDPTAAYFGAKKGSEPLHIQWNAATDEIEVVNLNAGQQTGLSAQIEILNSDGSSKWTKSATLDSSEDSTQSVAKLEPPAGLTPVYFIRLRLTRGSDLLSENFYWRGTQEGDYRALRTLAKATVDSMTKAERRGGGWHLTTELRNTSSTPALMIHLKVVRDKSGDRILPALYSDNYVNLMPGESKTITTELDNADTRGEQPRMTVDGFNVTAAGTSR